MRSGLVLVLLLVGCGGGGGGTPAPVEVTINFGLLRADLVTTRTIQVDNPLEFDATVELVEELPGPFKLDSLPAFVPAGGVAFLDIVFTPSGFGDFDGQLTLKFTRSGGSRNQDAIVSLRATTETPTLELTTPVLDYGFVRIGETARRTLSLFNASAITPIEVGALSPLPAAFDVVAGRVPVTLAPRTQTDVVIEYVPTELGAVSFTVTVSGLAATVRAETVTWIPEVVTEYGPVPVVDGETEWLDLEVPRDAISFSLEVLGPENAVAGLLGLEGPGGRIYENEDATGDLLWTSGDDGVFTVTVPNSDRESVQLVAGGGTYRFRLFVLAGTATSLTVRAIVHNRPGGVADGGVLDLNIFLAPALDVSAGDAPFETRLQGILDEVERIYDQQDLQIGKVTYYTLNDSRFNDVTATEFPLLLETSDSAVDVALNVFYVRRALGGGTLGVAARVPGPALNGTKASGVMVDYDFGSVATAAHVTAHEIGHYLGLFHTAERGGGHDLIDDTLNCPDNGTDDVCLTEGGDYLMHWRVLDTPNPIVTDGQGLVILGHPLVGPPSTLTAVPLRRAPVDRGALDVLPDDWCGTCGCDRR